MAPRGVRSVRASFADATAKPVSMLGDDPASIEPRDGYGPGAWPGAPYDQLPPSCPVSPLGIDGKTAFFIDSIHQLIDVSTSEWGKKMLVQLFCARPNFIGYAWPRWSEGKGGKKPVINGVDVDDACACLLKAAAAKGLFDPANRVRGRGAWLDKHGRLIWHSGERLWTVDGGKLKASLPGEIDGLFYPRRPAILEPWAEPVSVADSPAQSMFEDLCSWNWERGPLDALIAFGGIGSMFVCGALRARPHLAPTGDFGVGKSALNDVIRGALDTALIDAANATEAGVRQHMGLDALPVAIDEFEGSEDNRRVNGIIELARVAYSGGRILRGGQDHKGVEFIARNSFFCSGINLPPMKSQDKSRFAVLNLNKLKIAEDADGKPKAPPVVRVADGRMLLRQLMDGWHDFPRALADWKLALHNAGLSSRAQDTYGTLFAVAELLLGIEAMEEAGLPVTDHARLGAAIALATADERAEQVENWRACLEHLLGSGIDAHKGGERLSIGGIIEQIEKGGVVLDHDRASLATAGCAVLDEPDASLPHGQHRFLLAVPHSSPALNKLFEATRWKGGVWSGALKQGRSDGVVRAGDRVVKINRVSSRCLLVDIRKYDEVMGA